MEGNYTLSDLATITNGNGIGGNNGLLFLLLIVFLMNGTAWNRGGQGEFGQYATAASQQQILFGQQFQNLDNKADRLGDGISNATYALNNTIVNGNNQVAGAVVAEGRSLGDKIYDLKTAVHAEGEATRAMIQQNKIDSLTAQVNELKTQNMFCGIPRINPYGYQVVPNATGCGCNCGNI